MRNIKYKKMREFLFGDLWVQFSVSKSVHHIEKIVIIRRNIHLGCMQTDGTQRTVEWI